MVLIGSALIVGGAESNTIATTEAALSKLGTSRISKWDFAAVLASLIGGICTPLIVFSTRQPELADTFWRWLAVTWGPLILGIAGVGDFYGANLELALSKRDYIQALGEWLEERRVYNESHGIAEPEPVPEPIRFDPAWPEASQDDVLRLTAGLNGNRATFSRDELLRILFDNRMRPLSESTVTRWVGKVKEAQGER